MIIINADDFGMNEHCSKAIALAFERGLVTDTTIVANGDYFFEASALAKKQGFFSRIGIHLNLTEGKPLTEEIKKLPDFVTDGKFNKQYDRSRKLSSFEEKAVYAELSAQFDKIEKSGIRITHADSHHYIHNAENLALIIQKICKEHNITKIRLMRNFGNLSDSVKQKAEEYKAELRSNGFITTDYFGRLCEARGIVLPENIELLVHPDFDRNGRLIDRRAVENGYPAGKEIVKLSVDRGHW